MLTTKAKIIIFSFVGCLLPAQIAVGCMCLRQVLNQVNAHEEVPFVSLKGKYKMENQQENCPVCSDKKDVVKAFQCDHPLCEECLDGINKAHAEGVIVHVNLGIFEIPINHGHDINLVCPLCRAELKN